MYIKVYIHFGMDISHRIHFWYQFLLRMLFFEKIAKSHFLVKIFLQAKKWFWVKNDNISWKSCWGTTLGTVFQFYKLGNMFENFAYKRQKTWFFAKKSLFCHLLVKIFKKYFLYKKFWEKTFLGECLNMVFKQFSTNILNSKLFLACHKNFYQKGDILPFSRKKKTKQNKTKQNKTKQKQNKTKTSKQTNKNSIFSNTWNQKRIRSLISIPEMYTLYTSQL